MSFSPLFIIWAFLNNVEISNPHGRFERGAFLVAEVVEAGVEQNSEISRRL